jgi:2,4-dichlorophenol 6-monooxygenase
MEVLRDLGLETEALADGTPSALPGDTVLCIALAGEEIGRIRTWVSARNRRVTITSRVRAK